MPAAQPKRPHHVFHVPRLALRAGAIAFVVGLLLFALVWWSGRDKAFYTAPSLESSAPLAEIDSLPQPLPAGDGASDMPDAGAPSEPRPRLDEVASPAPPPAPIDEGLTRAPVQATISLPDQGDAATVTAEPVPLKGRNAGPRYPPAALRRRQSGTVLVRVDVDASGMPARVVLEQRSGSRDLDRAALEAVRDWRFQPAQRDGQPVPGSLVIPIDFRLD